MSGSSATLIAMPIEQPSVLRGGEIHYRDVELKRGDFLQVVVEQQGIDVVLRLRQPDGSERLSIDSPNLALGMEELVEIVETPGLHRVEIIAGDDAEAGSYELRQWLRRPSSDLDQQLVAADCAYREGRRLRADKRFAEAGESFTEALAAWRRLVRPARQAETLRQLGFVRKQIGDLPAARQAWEEALVGYRAYHPHLVVYLLQDLGKLELRLGAAAAALAYLDEGIELLGESGPGWIRVLTFAARGAAHRLQGNLQLAIEDFDIAAEISRQLADPKLERTVLIDRGSLLLDLAWAEEAIEAYRRARDLCLQLEDRRYLVLALRGIADAALRLGDNETAEEAVLQAIDAAAGVATEVQRGTAFVTLGSVYREQRDWTRARLAYDEARGKGQTSGNRELEAIALTGLAQIEIGSQQPQRGLKLHRQALKIFQEIGSQTGEAMSRARSAEALRDLGSFAEAWQELRQALATIEGVRLQTERRDLRQSYFMSRQEYYEIAVDLMVRSAAAEPAEEHLATAFDIHERRLARELLESLAMVNDDPPATAAAASVRQKQLESQLSELALESSSESAARAAELTEEIHRLRGEIRAAGLASAPRPIESTRLEIVQRDLLDDATRLLVYALGEEAGHLFEISRHEVRVHSLPARQAVEAQAEAFAKALASRRPRGPEERRRIGSDLGRKLLAPIAARLEGVERLVIVANGGLQTLPFAALPSPREASRFLIEDHEIVHLPSLSTLVSLRANAPRRAASQGGVAIFADPVFTASDPRVSGHQLAKVDPGSATAREVERLASVFDPASLHRLPASRTEAEAIRAWVSDQDSLHLVIDFAASRDAFVQRLWSDVDTLHLATHAFTHRRAELSGLLFSLVDPEGQARAGFVTALEIARMSVPVELVVLSACQTGIGRGGTGEASLGLTWSFLRSGAARVVASLWNIDDRLTAELMARFYRAYIGEGLPAVAALRRAQVEILREEQSLPYHWAGFFFVGDWQSPARPAN